MLKEVGRRSFLNLSRNLALLDVELQTIFLKTLNELLALIKNYAKVKHNRT